MKEKVIELYKSGLSYSKVAEILGCSKATVNYYCSEFSRIKNKVTIKDKDFIQKLRNEGKTLIEISIITGFGKSTISNHINNKVKLLENVLNVNYKKEKYNTYCREIKKRCVDYKGGKCEICGYNKCNRSLQFHHLNLLKKDFAISGGTRCFEKLKLELDKCILVCSNCHGEIHEKIENEKFDLK